jgi:hypothetical protein
MTSINTFQISAYSLKTTMPITDFADYAQPLVDQLTDDPDRPPPEEPPGRCTFPGGPDLDGDLQPIHPNEEDSLVPVGGNTPVSDEDSDAARGAYPMVGLDVLAFYKSFRFRQFAPFRGKWGIFLIDAGVAGLTADLNALEPKLPISEARQLAMDLLLAHERYHFWIDAWALGQEITPLIRPKFKCYEPYLSGKRQVDLTPDDYEESLANHYAFQKLKRRNLSIGGTASSIVRQVLELAPIPYCSFSFDKLERSEREGYLALAVANGLSPIVSFTFSKMHNVDPSILGASLKPADRWHPIAGFPNCPVYYVHTYNYAQLIQPFQGPELKEFKSFVINYLAGTKEKKTDHQYYRIDNGQKVRIPNPHDKTARNYELKGTLFKAGMTSKEFIAERLRTGCWNNHCPRPEPKLPRKEND